MASMQFLGRFLGDRLLDEVDDGDERLIRRTLSIAWVVVSLITPVWGVIYILFDEVVAGLIPIVYGILTFVSFGLMRWLGSWEFWRKCQMIQHLLLPFFLMWELGGFGASSAVLIWSLLAPMSSLWAGHAREALSVLGGFVALTVFSAFIDLSDDGWPLDRNPYLLETNVPGIFAVGDVRDGVVRRVASAVGQGSTAISMVHQYLKTV